MRIFDHNLALLRDLSSSLSGALWEISTYNGWFYNCPSPVEQQLSWSRIFQLELKLSLSFLSYIQFISNGFSW